MLRNTNGLERRLILLSNRGMLIGGQITVILVMVLYKMATLGLGTVMPVNEIPQLTRMEIPT
jgi:hypothetical protein